MLRKFKLIQKFQEQVETVISSLSKQETPFSSYELLVIDLCNIETIYKDNEMKSYNNEMKEVMMEEDYGKWDAQPSMIALLKQTGTGPLLGRQSGDAFTTQNPLLNFCLVHDDIWEPMSLRLSKILREELYIVVHFSDDMNYDMDVNNAQKLNYKMVGPRSLSFETRYYLAKMLKVFITILWRHEICHNEYNHESEKLTLSLNLFSDLCAILDLPTMGGDAIIPNRYKKLIKTINSNLQRLIVINNNNCESLFSSKLISDIIVEIIPLVVNHFINITGDNINHHVFSKYEPLFEKMFLTPNILAPEVELVKSAFILVQVLGQAEFDIRNINCTTDLVVANTFRKIESRLTYDTNLQTILSAFLTTPQWHKRFTQIVSGIVYFTEKENVKRKDSVRADVRFTGSIVVIISDILALRLVITSTSRGSLSYGSVDFINTTNTLIGLGTELPNVLIPIISSYHPICLLSPEEKYQGDMATAIRHLDGSDEPKDYYFVTEDLRQNTVLAIVQSFMFDYVKASNVKFLRSLNFVPTFSTRHLYY